MLRVAANAGGVCQVSEWRGMAAAAAAAKEKEAEAALVGPCVRTADEQEAEGSDDGDASVETANWPNGNPKGKDDDEQEPAEDDAMVVDNPGAFVESKAARTADGFQNCPL
jgi:hypothetical protein